MKAYISLIFLAVSNVLLGEQALSFEEPSYIRRKELYPQLCQADFTAFDRAFQSGDAGLLWFYALASHRNVEETRTWEYAKKLLSRLSGHTQNFIDRIEQKAESTKSIYSADGKADGRLAKIADTEEELRVLEDLREKAMTNAAKEFIALQQLGSPECVQTLMTYLDDERRIGGSFSQFGFKQGSTNQWLAIGALSDILRDENPAKEEFETHGKPYNVPAMVRRFKAWWLSDESKKWRTPVIKTTRSYLLPGASKDPETAPAHAWALETFQRDALWPILLILCLAGLAAVLGFTKLRRG